MAWIDVFAACCLCMAQCHAAYGAGEHDDKKQTPYRQQLEGILIAAFLRDRTDHIFYFFNTHKAFQIHLFQIFGNADY